MSVLEYICIRGSFTIPVYIRMPKYKCPHFLPSNRTPHPLCLIGSAATCWLWYLLVLPTYHRQTMHKKCSLPTVCRISMSWTRRWFSKWSVCWHNVTSGPRNCRIMLTSFMANSWKTFSTSPSTASTITSQITPGIIWTTNRATVISRILIYKAEVKKI